MVFLARRSIPEKTAAGRHDLRLRFGWHFCPILGRLDAPEPVSLMAGMSYRSSGSNSAQGRITASGPS